MEILIPFSRLTRCASSILTRHAVAAAWNQDALLVRLEPSRLSDSDLAMCAAILFLIGERPASDALRLQLESRVRLAAVWRGSDHACN